MRTTGTLQDVYDAVKNIQIGNEQSPQIDPVIRRYSGYSYDWALESGMEDAEGCIFEISMDEFIGYFYESFQADDYEITQNDIDFLSF